MVIIFILVILLFLTGSSTVIAEEEIKDEDKIPVKLVVKGYREQEIYDQLTSNENLAPNNFVWSQSATATVTVVIKSELGNYDSQHITVNDGNFLFKNFQYNYNGNEIPIILNISAIDISGDIHPLGSGIRCRYYVYNSYNVSGKGYSAHINNRTENDFDEAAKVLRDWQPPIITVLSWFISPEDNAKYPGVFETGKKFKIKLGKEIVAICQIVKKFKNGQAEYYFYSNHADYWNKNKINELLKNNEKDRLHIQPCN